MLLWCKENILDISYIKSFNPVSPDLPQSKSGVIFKDINLAGELEPVK